MLILLSIMIIHSSDINATVVDKGGVIDINILPSIIDLELPLKPAFNVGEDDIQPNIRFKNKSNIPITVNITNITKKDRITPDLIMPDTYTEQEWKYLTRTETHKEIALGILTEDDGFSSTKWLLLEGGPYYLGEISARGDKNFKFTTVTGTNWTKNFEIKYEFTIVISPIFH